MGLGIPPLHRRLYPLEMRTHAFDRECLVSLLERFEDGEMLLVVPRAGRRATSPGHGAGTGTTASPAGACIRRRSARSSVIWISRRLSMR